MLISAGVSAFASA